MKRLLTMRKVKELLRLKFDCKLSNRQVAKSINVSPSTVSYYSRAAKLCFVDDGAWRQLSDTELEAAFAPYIRKITKDVKKKLEPDYATMHQEIKRHKGVTLELLYQEFVAQAAGKPVYSYSQVCVKYRKWKQKLKLSQRHTHKAGEKLFVDYCGPTVPITNPDTGEIHKAQIFVAVLGASNYTFSEATWSQKLDDWLGSHIRAFKFIGGVPESIVIDNLKSGVTKACRYDPDVNQAYAALIAHYNTVVLPARPKKPKDKSKVEQAVLVVERWILAKLRHRQFFCLDELNAAIRELLTDLNNRPFKKLPGTRHSQLQELDKPKLKPLPTAEFELAEYCERKVAKDYHVEVDKHAYSVPYKLVGESVYCRVTSTVIEILHGGKRVASHQRSYNPGGRTTCIKHMPSAHRQHQGWTPQEFLNWANSIGPATMAVANWSMQRYKHVEKVYRVHLGLRSLSKKYGNVRFELACTKALAEAEPRHASIKSILVNHLDGVACNEDSSQDACTSKHSNVRGKSYYI